MLLKLRKFGQKQKAFHVYTACLSTEINDKAFEGRLVTAEAI